MKVFIVLAIAVFTVVSGGHHGKPDYHWRDFNGTVPSDALRVAQNGSDVPVYIGLGYFDNVGLLPGMLKEGEMSLTIAAQGRVITANKNIKIMCVDSGHPETDFQWILINFDDLESLQTLSFLSVPAGGTENDSVVYIGRHSDPNYTNIGKVYTVAPYQGLTVPDAEQKYTIYKNFEILTLLSFDCDQEKTASSAEDSNESSGGMRSSHQRSSNKRTIKIRH